MNIVTLLSGTCHVTFEHHVRRLSATWCAPIFSTPQVDSIDSAYDNCIMKNTQRTLIDFIKNHCDYLAAESSELVRFIRPESSNDTCPVCLANLIDTELRLIQINLETCHHVFDEACFSYYVLAGFSNCPLCRARCHELLEGETSNLNTISPAEEALLSSDTLRSGMRGMQPFASLDRRHVARAGEIALRSRLPNVYDRSIDQTLFPYGSDPLFNEYPDWADQEDDVDRGRVHDSVRQLRGGSYIIEQ